MPNTNTVHHFYPIAFVEHMKLIFGGTRQVDTDILFPLSNKPTNDKDGIHKNFYWADNAAGHQATYNSNRESGRRKHAARDLYTHPYADVVAMCSGKVLSTSTTFADGTGAVTVLHDSKSGKKFIARYGEVENSTVKVKQGDSITQGKLIGKTGFLRTWYKGVVSGYEVFMLHLEMYDGSQGFDVNKQLSNSILPFKRRSDLIDSLDFLKESYIGTFEGLEEDNRVDVKALTLSQNGIDFIKKWESIDLNYYNDSEDYCTIGYGHLIAKDKCENIVIPPEFINGITEVQAESLFKKDLIRFEEAVKNEIKVPLHQYEYDALVSLLFNTGKSFLSVGGANKGDTKIKTYINQMKYIEGANEMVDVNNGGVFGLTRRRQAEINIFKNNIYDPKP